MISKKVHWSQYADEISFLTIQDTVPLSDSLDDDYFSEESADYEFPGTPENVIGMTKNNKRSTLDLCQCIPKDEYSLRKSALSAKSGRRKVYIGNYPKEPEFLPRGRHFPVKENRFSERKFKLNERWRNADYEDENMFEDEMTFSDFSDDKSTLSFRGSEDTLLDNLSSSRKSQDSFWISPQISLSKRNSNALSRGGGRLDSAHKCEGRLSRRSFQDFDACQYRTPKVRLSSETRKSRLEEEEFVIEEEKPSPRRSSKAQYDFIAEDIKPSLPKTSVKLRRSKSEKPRRNRHVAKCSSKSSRKSNSA